MFNKIIDNKFKKIEFRKICEDSNGVLYQKYDEDKGHVQLISIYKNNDEPFRIESYNRDIMDNNKIGNICIGLSLYETVLCVCKIIVKGWYK